MSKKKIVSLCLVLALAAIAVVGGTVAYFTDTDNATNTFTVGKVDITLNETDNQGNPFVQDQMLLPGANNAIAKNVTVTVVNDSQPAWVWVEVLIPADLYRSKTETNETNNALHFNQFINYLQGYTGTSSNANAVECAKVYTNADHQWSTMKYIDEVTVDGVAYARLRTTHKDIVVGGVTTSPAVNQFYMDDDVYYDETAKAYMIPAYATAADPATEFVPYEGSWKAIVNAYAMQAEGFATVDAAIAAYK